MRIDKNGSWVIHTQRGEVVMAAENLLSELSNAAKSRQFEARPSPCRFTPSTRTDHKALAHRAGTGGVWMYLI